MMLVDYVLICDGELIVVVDMGLNSFYMVVVCVEYGELWVIDCLCDIVCMVVGLCSDGMLDVEYCVCVFNCFKCFGQCLVGLFLLYVCVVVINMV